MPENKFDQLLHAMTTRPALAVERQATAPLTSSAGASEGSGETQTPKGKSVTKSEK